MFRHLCTAATALVFVFCCSCQCCKPCPDDKAVPFVQSAWSKTSHLAVVPDDELTSADDRLLHAVGVDFCYEAMYGPQQLGTTDYGQVTPFLEGDGSPCLRVGPASGNTVTSSYAFLIGRRPRGATKWVKGTSSSTQMIIQVDKSVVPETHRIYLLNPTPCDSLEITPDGSTVGLEITSASYVEVQWVSGAARLVGPVHAIDPAVNPAAITAFLDDVQKRAAAKNLIVYPVP